jgi:hypothetical protein
VVDNDIHSAVKTEENISKVSDGQPRHHGLQVRLDADL